MIIVETLCFFLLENDQLLFILLLNDLGEYCVGAKDLSTQDICLEQVLDVNTRELAIDGFFRYIKPYALTRIYGTIQ